VAAGVTWHRHRANKAAPAPAARQESERDERTDTPANHQTFDSPPQSGYGVAQEEIYLSTGSTTAPGQVLSQTGRSNAPTEALPEAAQLPVLSGTVTDVNTGEPIAGATVNYRYKRSRYEDPNGKYITETDAQGQFRMEVGPLQDYMQWFVFRHPDYARVLNRGLQPIPCPMPWGSLTFTACPRGHAPCTVKFPVTVGETYGSSWRNTLSWRIRIKTPETWHCILRRFRSN
jgi:hypothetical protein